MKNLEISVNPQEIQRYVRSRFKNIEHIEQFEQELQSTINQKHDQYSKFITQQIKIKQIKQEKAFNELARRNSMNEQLQQKLRKSQIKRKQDFQKKHEYQKKQKQYRKSLFTERIGDLRKQEYRDRMNKLESYKKKYENAEQVTNFISPKTSDLSTDKHMIRKSENIQAEYERKVKMAQDRRIFEKPHLKQRQLSLSEIVPRQIEFNKRLEQQRVDKMGERLAKIEKKLKDRETAIEEKVKRLQSIQKYKKSVQEEKLKDIKKQQQLRRKSLKAKLQNSSNVPVIKSQKSLSSSFLKNSFAESENRSINKSEVIEEKLLKKNETQMYRRKIRQAVNQFLQNEKKKVLIGN